MTEYSKQIFSDPKLLREKLEIYLQTPDKVENYAKYAEKSFMKGKKNKIKVTMSPSLWGFLGNGFWLLYRKCYWLATLVIILSLMLRGILLVFWALILLNLIFYGKFYILQRFVKYLDLQDDEKLSKAGGYHEWAVWVCVILYVWGFVSANDLGAMWQNLTNS